MTQNTARRRAPRPALLARLVALIIPLVLIGLFLILRGDPVIAQRAEENIAAPLRDILARVTSFGPLRYISVSEILIAAYVVWAAAAFIALIAALIRRKARLTAVLRHLALLVTVAAWVLSLFSWTWGIGYNTPTLAQETGLVRDGVATEDLFHVTALFAERASALSREVPRDGEGRFAASLDDILAGSASVYDGIQAEFSALSGRAYPPKPMVFSKLMSYLGFTGVYYGFTGEANVNVDQPALSIPFTIAHEMAHQRGVHSEDEANFASIAACITSGDAVYAYSGYFSGLIYLSGALYRADPEAWRALAETISPEVWRDMEDHYAYWERFETPAAEAASAVYDNYLKSQGQTLGVQSYGACVDLLVAWLAG